MDSKLFVNDVYPSWRAGCDAAHNWLAQSGKDIKILVEQNRNLGDTLHLTPVIRHYRLKYPQAAIAFIVGAIYSNAHEFNPDVDKIFCIPSLAPHDRIELRKHIMQYQGLAHIIAPSIFPYAAIWKELNWSYADIASQYFANSGIADIKPIGGRKLIVTITPQDQEWATNFMAQHELTRKTTCALEYNSYSAQPVWVDEHFRKFVSRAELHGIKCVSLAGPHEKPIRGSINATGLSWRKTVALLNLVGSFIGVGSGLTMLAASTTNSPHILEIAVDDPVNMIGCGYANSIKIVNTDPSIVADHLWYKVLNG